MKLEQIKKLIRQDKLVKFYQHRSWRHKRHEALIRDNFECQRCKGMGRVSASRPTHSPYDPSPVIENKKRNDDKHKRNKSLHVHHKKEVKDYPELALVLDNLETLCVTCHNEEHDRLKDYKGRPNFINEERW